MSSLKKILKSVTQLQKGSWEDHWKSRNLTWDAGQSSPALLEIIDSLPNGKYLVPGCGYGYDVLEFRKRNHSVVGLDLSSTCIALCQEKYNLQLSEKMKFICQDFFKHNEMYDGAYDYTFFCALPLDFRRAWGIKMGELIKKNGILVTLMFPIDDHLDGPPFSVKPDDYSNVLCDKFTLKLLADCTSFKQRQGREKLGIWTRN